MTLLNKAKEFNQEHLFAFYDELSEGQKKNLLADIENIDFSLMKDLYENVACTKEQKGTQSISPISCTDATAMTEAEKSSLYSKGLESLSKGSNRA